MTQSNPSRSNLQDILSQIETSDMPRQRRRDMASAVRTIAKALDSRPSDSAADPRMLGIRLKKISAIALGLTQRRWNNVRSLLRQALKLARSIMAGRSTGPLLARWEALMMHFADNVCDG